MRRPSLSHPALFAVAFGALTCAPSGTTSQPDPHMGDKAGARTLARATAPVRKVPTTPPLPAHALEPETKAAVEAPKEIPYTRIIDPSRAVPGSLSMGSTSGGVLLTCATLPHEGEHHAVLPNCHERNTNYGTEELIELLIHGAQGVSEAHPGPRLMLGNLSVRGGGDIKWSRSHNSGRDADIAFYVLDKKGNPVEAPSLLDFGSDLATKDGAYRLDVPRNWTLVKTLMSHETIQVQWLFAASWIRDALIEYAEEQGEPEALIERVRKVLWQPTDSSPHSNHLHLRIYCSRDDIVEGCLNGSPVWAWVDTHEDAFEMRVAELVRGLGDPDVEIRREVLGYLGKLRAVSAAPAVATIALFDDDTGQRLDALEMLARWRAGNGVVMKSLEALIRSPGEGIARDDPGFTFPARSVEKADPLPDDALPEGAEADKGAETDTATPTPPPRADPYTFDDTRTPAMLRRAYSTLGQMGSNQSIPLLVQALTSDRLIGNDPKQAVWERELAANACRNIMSLRLVPALIDALDTPDQDTRAAVSRTLRRITNHSFKVRWEKSMKNAVRIKNVDKWRRWWRANKHRSRSALVLRGFKQNKIRIKNLTSYVSVDKLVGITSRDDHLGYNAARVVARRTGRWHMMADSSASRRSQKWKRWWRKNRKRVRRDLK